MAVVTSATPDWMAALRAKKRDKKEDGPKVQPAKGLDSQPPTKATSAWSRKFDSSKTNGSPSSHAAQRSAVQNGGTGQTTKGAPAQSSTLPRSFGRGGTTDAAAPPSVAAVAASSPEKKRPTDDSTVARGKSSTLESAGRRASGKEVKPSVSALRSLFSQRSSEPVSSSPKLLSSRPRSDSASSSAKAPGTPGDRTTSASTQTTTSSSNSATRQTQRADAAEPGASSAADRLRHISEERDASSKASPAMAATGAKRKTGNDDAKSGKLPAAASGSSQPVAPHTQNSTVQQKRAAAAASAAARRGSSSDSGPAAGLQCTNIDDFIADKDMLRAFSLDSAVHRLQGSECVMSAPASATGSPECRPRRHSILLTPDRKQMQPKLKRRVSFSELRLETVHQFQREEKVPSDDEEDDDVRGMVRRAMVVDDSDGLCTELHPRLSPLSAGRPPKRKPMAVFVSSPEDDEPPDMYTDVPDSVAALLM